MSSAIHQKPEIEVLAKEPGSRIRNLVFRTLLFGIWVLGSVRVNYGFYTGSDIQDLAVGTKPRL